MSRPPAPIVHDAERLLLAVLHRLDESGVVSRRTFALTVQLVESLTLAANGRDRHASLREADRALLLVRSHLRLSNERGDLTEDQLVHLLELADRVGRQLGGWRKSLASELPPA